jgi:hypothetical protein
MVALGFGTYSARVSGFGLLMLMRRMGLHFLEYILCLVMEDMQAMRYDFGEI